MSFPEMLIIEHAEHIGGRESYLLRLRFNDGTKRDVDFKKFLESSTNPLIRAYLDPDRFATFALNEGDLMWGDYELCFPVADLYDGQV
jgi:hypothetical protein